MSKNPKPPRTLPSRTTPKKAKRATWRPSRSGSTRRTLPPQLLMEPRREEVVCPYKMKVHAKYVRLIAPVAVDADEEDPAVATILSLVGAQHPSEDHHLGAFPIREALASDFGRRVRQELSDPLVTMCHVEARLPGCKMPVAYAKFNGRGSSRDLRELKRLSQNSGWAIVPRIIQENGELVLDLVLEGIIFERNLLEELEVRAREPNFRLTRAGRAPALTFNPLGRDERKIREAVRGMFCLQRCHLPQGVGSAEVRRAALHLLHIRAMIEGKALSKIDTGEGKVHSSAAHDLVKRLLPDRKAAAATAAPKAERARDIVRLMRSSGFIDHELPFIKI